MFHRFHKKETVSPGPSSESLTFSPTSWLYLSNRIGRRPLAHHTKLLDTTFPRKRKRKKRKRYRTTGPKTVSSSVLYSIYRGRFRSLLLQQRSLNGPQNRERYRFSLYIEILSSLLYFFFIFQTLS
jgi:hypothetical protein